MTPARNSLALVLLLCAWWCVTNYAWPLLLLVLHSDAALYTGAALIIPLAWLVLRAEWRRLEAHRG
ncbi:MAG TPA: hypothetical protein VHN99_01130 [Deinococcales bacterium]|nr:hypothetical protein [Deinococcales bacterium]